MERESFVFYKSFMVGVESLSTDEEKLKAYQYILRYGFYGEEPEETTGPAFGMFAISKANIDANNKKYVDGCKGGQYGTMGGRPKKNWDNSQKPLRGLNNNPSGVKKITPNDNDNDNDNVNDNDNEKGYGEKQDTQTTLDANASRGNIEKKNEIGIKKSMMLSDKLKSLGLQDEIVDLAIIYDGCKKGKKLNKFDDKQLGIWVNKLKKCGFDTIEGMKEVLENSIAGGYEGIFELKQKPQIKPQTFASGSVIKVGDANIFI